MNSCTNGTYVYGADHAHATVALLNDGHGLSLLPVAH
jgi:hypothetical protein